MMKVSFITSLCILLVASCQAFAPVTTSRAFRTVSAPITNVEYAPVALQRQRKSVANVQTMGLFGLGAPEIAVILVAAAFLLGPQ